MHADLGDWEGLAQATETLPMDPDKEIPFQGFPPLPKVFRESGSSPSPSPPPGTRQEAAGGTERRSSSLHDNITQLHAEMRRVRRADQALFYKLRTLALEIHDLRELQREMESSLKEEPFAEGQEPFAEGQEPFAEGQEPFAEGKRRVGGGGGGPPTYVPSTVAVVDFELTI